MIFINSNKLQNEKERTFQALIIIQTKRKEKNEIFLLFSFSIAAKNFIIMRKKVKKRYIIVFFAKIEISNNKKIFLKKL